MPCLTMTCPFLPEALVIEILSRLPVKSLMRFRCVCKFWCSLTKDLSFITMHQKQQETDNKKNGRLLVHYYDEDSKKSFFSLFPDEAFGLPCYQYPDLALHRQSTVMGPCNGIFCLYNGSNAVALWNPATRQFRTLPELPSPKLKSESHSVIGFGFDPKTNDYKVIWIRFFKDIEEGFDINDMVSIRCQYKQVGVFALSGDSWRELNRNLLPASHLYHSISYPYADGFYYWFASDNGVNRFIVSFDMANEVFLAIPEPDGIPESEKILSCTHFAFYENYLALILFNYGIEGCYNVWVLKEECWKKMATIGPLVGEETALGFWKNGGLFLRSVTKQLVVSDPVTGEIKDVGVGNPLRVFIYCESLVSVWRGNDSMGQDLPDFFRRRSLKRVRGNR